MDYKIYEASRVSQRGSLYCLVKDSDTGNRYLGVSGDAQGFSDFHSMEDGFHLYPLNPSNTDLLTKLLPWLKPQPLGTRFSMGFGDRLGMATPGHVAAVQGTEAAPIFAQQSVRENTRLARSPQQVLNDAVWGLFQEGWQQPWGADADHIKSIQEIDNFIQAGYSFYTLDLTEQLVDVRSASPDRLKEWVEQLPWDQLMTSPDAFFQRYLDRRIDLEGCSIEFTQSSLLQGIAKYGRAIAQVISFYQYLKEVLGNNPFDLEISLDETDDPTSVQDHYLIAAELMRAGVNWQSLAPRYVGDFYKGIDYAGDVDAFTANLRQHAAIMRYFGTYKLSLHSGSDKLSIYPIFSALTGGQIHVKTAGTSYLEALRVVAQYEPPLFAQILDFSRARFPQDRATYHLNAVLEKVPDSASIREADLPTLLDDDHARQVLHVTFGSVISRFGVQLKNVLSRHEDDYKADLREHFSRHLSLLLH